MDREIITDGQAFCIAAFFIMGSTLIIGTGRGAQNDMWISIIVGAVMALPVVLLYARLLSLFPGRDLFDIVHILFGKFVGKLIALLYVWYAFHLGALVIRNFGEFINTVAMPETPFLVPMLLITVLSIWTVKGGIEVMGRSAIFLLPIAMVVVIVTHILALHQYNISFLKPVLNKGWTPVLKGAFSAFSFPFSETVLFTGIFYSLRKKIHPIGCISGDCYLAEGLY